MAVQNYRVTLEDSKELNFRMIKIAQWCWEVTCYIDSNFAGIRYVENKDDLKAAMRDLYNHGIRWCNMYSALHTFYALRCILFRGCTLSSAISIAAERVCMMEECEIETHYQDLFGRELLG